MDALHGQLRKLKPDQYFRALDAVAAATQATEQHLYGALCDLANLDLRLVCYHCGVPAERDQGRGEGVIGRAGRLS